MIKYPSGTIVILPNDNKAEIIKLLWSKDHLEYWVITDKGTYLESKITTL